MGVVGRWGIYVAICAAVLFALLTADSPAAAQSALLDTLSTHVTLARDGAVDLVTDQRVIRSGDTVATDRTGHAVVTYPDGSTALLEESSELTIEFVHTTAGDYVVRMQQTLGRVWYAVARTIASGSRYEVHSAAMASVIRAGSSSFVAVLPGGETTVVATAGSVETSAGETSAGGTAITVPAGAAAAMRAAGTPPPQTPAAGARSAPKASQSAATASVKLAAATAPAVEPTAAPKPAAAPERVAAARAAAPEPLTSARSTAPERVAAARAAAPEPVTAAPGRDSKAEKA